MSKLIVEGGRPLRGEVRVSGAKNSALALMVAAALADGECELHNVPRDTDVWNMCSILRQLGATVGFASENVLHVDGRGVTVTEASYELVRRMRASFYVSGLLLARLGEARVPLPGGCQLGSRPVDFHLRGFEQLGAEVRIEHGYMKASASRLEGAEIFVERASVGTTINLMIAASTADGVTVLENAAKEPEIVDLAVYLNEMGARVHGAGTNCIRIKGVERLHPVSHAIIGDRIEAGTFLAAAAITGGALTLSGVEPEHLRTPLLKLAEAGLHVEEGDRRISAEAAGRMRSIDVETAPYPGFPTDLQQPLVALMSVSEGTSLVRETIFDRFRYVDELRRMGAEIKVDRDTAVVRGVERLTGAPVEAMDLRAGAALVLAGLAASGTTEVSGVGLIDRGYDRLDEKLRAVGAKIERLPEPDEEIDFADFELESAPSSPLSGGVSSSSASASFSSAEKSNFPAPPRV